MTLADKIKSIFPALEVYEKSDSQVRLFTTDYTKECPEVLEVRVSLNKPSGMSSSSTAKEYWVTMRKVAVMFLPLLPEAKQAKTKIVTTNRDLYKLIEEFFRYEE